ncbi:M56 family metallopeptidase [Gelidibacter salicanalis]|uniref:M56 family metallopeptidase n=1 Tax=Gelidibacter salicanalis TaxID=291193 RepID=A0A934NI18_9FLAO|nr:M56 family metallopeptidase [Gelidibacter salicanalis]MBJ7881521.1 M56 family metallopeptidase [Gelidibacter salicanalis]
MYYIQSAPQIEQTNYLPLILWSIYLIGVVLFSFRFFVNLRTILHKIKANPKHRYLEYTNVLLQDLVVPHTFLSYIFLNRTEYEHHLIPDEVLLHEQTHAKQKHAIDIIILEILQIVFWFNPLLYYIKKDIKLNHEFLADQAVLQKGINSAQYKKTLLAFSSNATEPRFTNSINYSLIKKRFTVMNTHTSKRKIWLRSSLLLPLLALTLYGFSEKMEVVKPLSNQTLSTDTIRDIIIFIDESNALKLNGVPVQLNDLKTEINKLNPQLTKEQKNLFLEATINYENSGSESFIERITSILIESDIYSHRSRLINDSIHSGFGMHQSKNQYIGKTIAEANTIYENQTMVLSPLNGLSSPWQSAIELQELQNGDSKPVKTELIKEYNAIAKNINSQAEGNATANMKDINRLMHIYHSMSKKQRQLSEPFPQFGHLQAANTQQKATPEEVAEYNKLAKQINSQPPNKTVIRLKDVKRLRVLYDKMSAEQKANAEPMPNFPPPPPPVAAGSTIKRMPLPAPPPPNATAEQLKAYEKAIKDYKAEQNYTYKHKTKEGKEVEVLVIQDTDDLLPPPPPPPVSPLAYASTMVKKNAQFFYEGNPISSDEALAILRKDQSLNISTTYTDANQAKVNITKDPIKTKNSNSNEVTSGKNFAIHSAVTNLVVDADTLEELKSFDFDGLRKIFSENQPDTMISVEFNYNKPVSLNESIINKFRYTMSCKSSDLDENILKFKRVLSKLESI